MKEYWTDRNVDPPPDPLFPFSESDISAAFAQSHGNPREAIRDLIPRLDTILYGVNFKISKYF